MSEVKPTAKEKALESLLAKGGLGRTVVYHLAGDLQKARVAIVVAEHPNGVRDLYCLPYRADRGVQMPSVRHHADPSLDARPEVKRRHGSWSTLEEHDDRR